MQYEVVFCASCRIALGKLRRVTNIAKALRHRRSDIRLSLIANSRPDVFPLGLMHDELALYDRVEHARPAEMAERLKSMDANVVVVGNMILRDLHKVDASLCLVLREVLPAELEKFRLKEDRAWDLVILPNPPGYWMPDPDIIAARRIESVGWIYRQPDPLTDEDRSDDDKKDSAKILLTTGGGSGEDSGNDLHSEITFLIEELRRKLRIPVKVIQVVGPFDWKQELFKGVDEMTRPGPELHNLFRKVDLVISAAGYNTVLELACTDVPVLLVPVPRYTDDQEKRALFWGKLLGMCYVPDQKQLSIEWMAEVLERRSRRAVVDIGPTGANRSAELIEDLLAQSNRLFR